MAQVLKKSTPPPIVFIILILAGIVIFKLPDWHQFFKHQTSSSLSERISLGDKILHTIEPNPEKEAGVNAFKKGDYPAAMQSFQAALKRQRNDPETVIYLNNARVGNRSSYRIAAVVPMGSNPNVAQEILRGVAQAQDEMNANGGVNGTGLQIEIVNDDNEPEVAKQVANTLINDNQILAVVGHNASNASLAAAPIYQKFGMVMITPTSFSSSLSGFGSYIFRTTPNIRATAALLADYVVKTDRKTKIAICYDSQAQDNISFKDEFVAALSSLGGKLVPSVCDLNAPTFNPDAAIAEALQNGAEGMLLTPHVDRISRAIAVARVNQGKLALYTSPTLYTIQTLNEGQSNVKGLVLTVPWHPDVNPSNPFLANARQRWGGTVNWRTATSYDATRTLIAALQQRPTRDGLQQVLRKPDFNTIGAGETVRFLPTGDRASTSLLVQVQSNGSNGYTFSLLR